MSREDFIHEWIRKPGKSLSIGSISPKLCNIDEGFECDVSNLTTTDVTESSDTGIKTMPSRTTLKISSPVLSTFRKIGSIDVEFDQFIQNNETSAVSTTQSNECLKFEKKKKDRNSSKRRSSIDSLLRIKDPYAAVNSVYQDAFFEKIRVEMRNQISTVANRLMPRRIYLAARFNYS